MSYTYRSTGKGIDLIVATQKGIEEGGMPKGVIIPNSYKFIPEVAKYIQDTSHNVYVAKHCDKENVLTHIQSEGIVNRFGWMLFSFRCYFPRNIVFITVLSSLHYCIYYCVVSSLC